MKNMKLKGKIILPTVTVVAALLIIVLVVAIVQFNAFNDYLVEERLESVANSVRHLTDDTRQQVIDVGLRLSYDPRLAPAVLSRDTQEILRVGREVVADYGVTYITVAGADTYVLARTDEPERFGDAFRTVSLLEALEGIVSVAYTPVGPRAIPIRSSVPLFYQGEIIGVVVVGYALDTQKAVERLAERYNAEFTIFVYDEASGRHIRKSSTLVDDHGNSVVGTHMTDEYILRHAFTQRRELSTTATLFGRQYSVFYMPLDDPAGNPLGTVFMGIPLDDVIAQRNSVIITVSVIGVVGLAVAIFVILRIANMISKPMVPLATFFNRAAEKGDIEFNQSEMSILSAVMDNSDEVAQLASAIVKYMKQLSLEMKLLERVADGDLTITPEILSDRDVVGNALSKVAENLNNMFSEIQSSTSQVATGSKQIADGAQALAQGSTQQTSSVQQLSASIGEIAQQTKLNADMAVKAASLASEIKGSAEKGSKQMDEMMSAVRDISTSSQNISKVIKSIDDIAFQTNILALNAAVEAARAGQHGKGFAVVAEEVRNLAAKSAEAAKDTEHLIADSIEKAELGSRIADSTAASLTEIVSGIAESNQLVSDIAKSSEEQSGGIEQVNRGIDQVAHVIQQNSATAQQSAAASQEMSGQSLMLEELISRFKLKNTKGFGSLSPRTRPAPPSPGLPPPSSNSRDTFGKY